MTIVHPSNGTATNIGGHPESGQSGLRRARGICQRTLRTQLGVLMTHEPRENPEFAIYK